MNASEKSIDPAETPSTTVRQMTGTISGGGDSFEQQYLTMEGTQQNHKQNLLL